MNKNNFINYITRDKAIGDKFINIPNTIQLVVNRLGTKLNLSTNQDTIKPPKVVEPMNKILYYKTLETSVINSPLSPSFLLMNSYHDQDVEIL